MADFFLAIPAVRDHEGGKVNDPTDRGGLTHFGITQIFLDDYAPGKKVVDIKTWEDAEAVYRSAWNRWRFEQLTSQLIANKVFDTFVLHGHAAFKILQRALCFAGKPIAVDGRFGPLTRAAANSLPEARLITELIHFQLRYVDDIVTDDPTQKRFERGWKIRARCPQELCDKHE